MFGIWRVQWLLAFFGFKGRNFPLLNSEKHQKKQQPDEPSGVDSVDSMEKLNICIECRTGMNSSFRFKITKKGKN